MYFSSEEWHWLWSHVSTHPRLPSSPTYLKDRHPKCGCALSCANTGVVLLQTSFVQGPWGLQALPPASQAREKLFSHEKMNPCTESGVQDKCYSSETFGQDCAMSPDLISLGTAHIRAAAAQARCVLRHHRGGRANNSVVNLHCAPSCCAQTLTLPELFSLKVAGVGPQCTASTATSWVWKWLCCPSP